MKQTNAAQSTKYIHLKAHVATEEPSPITALRDLLAEYFAAEVAVATPIVCEILWEQHTKSSNVNEKQTLRRATVLLTKGTHPLAAEIARDVRERFDAKISPPVANAGKKPGYSLDTLTLTCDAKLQEDFALEHCIRRMKEQSNAEIFALTARLCEMLGRNNLADSENPVVPRIFGSALLDNLVAIGCDPETKMAIFRAFGPMLLSIAPDVYAYANAMLADRGHLTEFKERYGKPVNLAPTPVTQKPPSQTLPELAELLDRLLTGSAVLASSHSREERTPTGSNFGPTVFA